MNRATAMFLMTLALLGWTACSSGSSDGPPPPAAVGSVTGLITNEAGTPLADVRVSTGSGASERSEMTNEQGFFALTGVPVGDPVVRYTRTGFVDNMRVVPVETGRNSQASFVLLSIGTSQTVDATQPVGVAHGGGRVDIPAGGIVDASGQAVTSAVVSVTTMAPGDARFTSYFPGEFVGVDNGVRGSLISYGVVDVTLRAADGSPLQLGQGVTAQLEFPLPANDPGDATIPLWWLDTETGEWVREGEVTRDAGASVFRGSVSHFTPWNVDKQPTTATKRVRLTVNGNPVVGISIRLRGSGWAAGGITGSDGSVSVPVPASSTATVEMLLSNGVWVTLRAGEQMPAGGQTIENVYTEADGVVQQVATVILRWGERPTDLDSHMTVPTSGSRSHVFFQSMGSLTASPWVALDTDDVTSFGPEITTVTRELPGVYRFTVHNYSTNASHPIQDSGAVVTLVLRDLPTRTYTVPLQNPEAGEFWAVFDLTFDALGNPTVTDLNQFGGIELLMR